MRRIDIPTTTDPDPVQGRALQRIIIDLGPPAAVALVFVEVRASGVRELPPIQVGDAVPEEVLAGLPPEVAAKIRRGDDRRDRATRLLSKIVRPRWIEEAITDLVTNGEL